MEKSGDFWLLQFNDALFPIGGYAHSYGLETYIQQGIVHNPETAAAYLAAYLEESFLYGDLLCARLAMTCAASCSWGEVARLEEIARASKTPREIREAAQKLGSRFVKTVTQLLQENAPEHSHFAAYTAALREKGLSPSHAVAYGVCCGCLGLAEKQAMRAFLYAQASATVNCFVKTIPLSQTDGQLLLSGSFSRMEQILERLEDLTEHELYRSAIGFDIRAMAHETLYSRLYMS
jgi:urease accessory protein